MLTRAISAELVQMLRGGLLAADVLLAGLQGQHEAALAVARSLVMPDEAARQLAHVLLLAGEQARVRAAELQRHAQRLPLADGDVGVQLAGRLEQAQRDRVVDQDEQRARRVDLARPCRAGR